MDTTAQFDTILEFLERLGIEVRLERLGGTGGGLCTLRGVRIVFVDLDADPATRLESCIRALSALPELETVFVPPAIRESIDRLDHRPG